MICPFKIGDRVHELRNRGVFTRRLEAGFDIPLQWELDMTKPSATVTEITERGFKYEYDDPVPFIPRWGMTFLGGECFEEGFQYWRKAP